jgi:hypothetical protein
MRVNRIHLISLSLILVLVLTLAACGGTIAPPKGDTAKGDNTLTSITLSCPQGPLKVGANLPYGATGNYADGTTDDISDLASWKSSDPGVATIQAIGGLVTAVAPGTTNITASLLGVTSDPDPLTVAK